MKKTLLIAGAVLVGLGAGYTQTKPVHAMAHAAAHATAHPAAHATAHAEATHTTTHATEHATTEHTTKTNGGHSTTVATHHTGSTKRHKDQYAKGYDAGYKNGKIDKKAKSHKHRKPSGTVSSSYRKGYAHGYKDGLK